MKMSWNSSAYTTLGSSMLTEALSGKRMTFTRAVGGAGTVQASELPNATEVADQKQSLILASSEMTGEGDDAAYKIKIQISNNGLQQGYTLHQIGIYAKLDDSDSDALAVIFQDDHGFEIQPEAAMNNFLMEFFGVLAISNTAQIYLTADPNTIATEKWVREILAKHDKDPNAHVDVISAALSAAIKKLEDSGQIMDEAAAKKFVREMLDQYGAAKDISFTDTMGTGASNLQQALDVVLGNTLPKLTVTTTAGSALTITDGQSTITGTATGGSFTTTLPRLGEWTVTASLAGLTTDDTITVDVVGGKYTLTLPYFAATLNVTTAPDAVVTATLSTGKAYTATADSSGNASVRIKRSGTYTVQASKGSATSDIAEVEILENGETYTATARFCTLTLTAPVGSTLTATCGDNTMTATVTGDAGTGTVKLYPPVLGTWSITAAKDGETTTETVAATAYKDYAVELAYVHIYGASWDGTSTTKWSRTDEAAEFTDPVPYVAGASSYGSPFDSLQPWAGMVKSERTGGTMVAIPKFWYKLEQNGAGMTIKIADRAVEGYSVSPAHMDRGDGHGERDVVYIGRYHCNSSYKSGTGSPKVNMTRSSARANIHSLGSAIWQSDFAMRFTLWLLYIVEFADWNSQAKIGYGCSPSSSAFTMGYTDSMPYHTGTNQSSRATYGGTQYRNIEGLWDNVWDWCDGCYNDGNGLNIVLNPSKFSDSSNGTAVGVPSNGWPSAFKVKANGGFPMFIPTSASGNDATYSCDYWVFDSSYPCLCVGGCYGHYSNYGLFFVYYSTASGCGGSVGCRLQELPNGGV